MIMFFIRNYKSTHYLKCVWHCRAQWTNRKIAITSIQNVEAININTKCRSKKSKSKHGPKFLCFWKYLWCVKEFWLTHMREDKINLNLSLIFSMTNFLRELENIYVFIVYRSTKYTTTTLKIFSSLLVSCNNSEQKADKGWKLSVRRTIISKSTSQQY